MDARFQLDGAVQNGDWGEGADPRDAYDEMVAQGFDPDDKYCVGGTTGGLLSVVHCGNLMECLREASSRSAEGYFVVVRASDLPNFKRVEVH